MRGYSLALGIVPPSRAYGQLIVAAASNGATLGQFVQEAAARLPVLEGGSPREVRAETTGQTVIAHTDSLMLLIEKVSLCVQGKIPGGQLPILWLREAPVSSSAERWVLIAAPDQFDAASNPDNRVPFTDDRASSFCLLDIAITSRLVTAAGGRVLCFREKKPGAVIALPRA